MITTIESMLFTIGINKKMNVRIITTLQFSSTSLNCWTLQIAKNEKRQKNLDVLSGGFTRTIVLHEPKLKRDTNRLW